ncbi:hypothetical protein OG497_37905 [Streptomyces sp. NBC_01242]|uniref:hypothetical protein n=1 Tax=Streptomyces sp. NBC_01242 TaxID=2903795 RepID=UPI00224D5532|nr:hypothetical protein [Streptomyces sp. NBC_01242]MCX4799634.1 hypothetical protein [Streptomyces sp. NBC_01242]
MEEIKPNALAECGDVDLDARPGVQEVTEEMIYAFVIKTSELPVYSAKPFARWLHTEAWFNFNEDGTNTVGDVLSGALADWRGNA